MKPDEHNKYANDAHPEPVANEPASSDKTTRKRKGRLGFFKFIWKLYQEQANDNLFVVAGGVAFYILLSIFPGIAALISLYGLVSDPVQVQQQFAILKDVIPGSAYDILNQQVTAIVSTPSRSLSFGIIFGLLFTIWSAARGMKALIIALNVAYNTKEERNILRFNLTALVLTFGTIIFILISLVLIVLLPPLFAYVDFLSAHRILISTARWVLLALFIMLGLSMIYRYAPNRKKPEWKCLSLGAIFATIIWILGSILFSFYVANFGSYNQTYGSMGAVIILMLWFYLTAYLILLGAELNILMEEHAGEDSDCGPG